MSDYKVVSSALSSVVGKVVAYDAGRKSFTLNFHLISCDFIRLCKKRILQMILNAVSSAINDDASQGFGKELGEWLEFFG